MAQKEQPTANRNYKDTVFRMLFSDRKNLLSLYNAIRGAHYDNPEMLEIVTLENAIYMGMKNDLAFIIDTDLFLYEHQSTYNPNMPLRDLFYISSEYQKLVDHKSLYSSCLLKVPAPQFIVFYNGTEKKKEQTDSMVITLENAIYMGMKNDLAFIIDTELFLYEHQSTYNPNMPLRDLFYISSEYQKLVDKKSLYSSVLQKIPAPQFIVFYNGTEKRKDSWVNHLSEAFENLPGNPKLELEVLTININEGHNEELMEHCQTLKEYARYVNCVRKYARELELNEAVKLAVDECIRNNILSEFLRANKSEVISMSIFEYDKEEEERKLRKAEYEAGVADGFNNGFNDGINTAKKDAAITLAELHMPIEQIALALKVDIEAVKEWLR